MIFNKNHNPQNHENNKITETTQNIGTLYPKTVMPHVPNL